MKKLIPTRKEIKVEKTEKEGNKKKEKEEKKEGFDIKRFLNENKRLIAGGIVSVLFLANLIHYFVLVICFLVLALYEKSEKTDAKTKKKGILEMAVNYIEKQRKTNHWAIFWFTIACLIFIFFVFLAFLLVVISLMLH